MDQIQEMLRYVFQTRNPLTFAVSGTGTAAMETAVANMVEPGDPVLVCANGYFGLRIAEMVERYGGELTALKRPWGEVFDLDEIESALEQSGAKVVAIVHAETSTGARQPLEGLADIVHNHGAVLIVDAVTSLGGLPLLVDKWDLDLVYSGTQKCLGCPPGLGPITLGPRAAGRLHARKTRVQNWYLDLTGLEKYWGAERAYHHTAPISAFYGLHEGLRLVVEEGLEGRWERHRSNAETFWEGLERIGLECHVPEQNRLPSLTTVRIPAGVGGYASSEAAVGGIQYRDRRRLWRAERGSLAGRLDGLLFAPGECRASSECPPRAGLVISRFLRLHLRQQSSAEKDQADFNQSLEALYWKSKSCPATE
jgi:alanine-glyoxylate transaminase / serine-glyoxylate transaminase / serine-pyruvate transaminase